MNRVANPFKILGISRCSYGAILVQLAWKG